MLHKIDLKTFATWVNNQPADTTLPCSKKSGIVASVFLRHIRPHIPIGPAQISLGYSSVLIRDGDSFELGGNKEQRLVAFDLDNVCRTKKPVTYGDLTILLAGFKEKMK